ncbi:stage II sporulation protein P [Bacillus sp. JJ1764]|uniref:stage II sporulation protein P n=1 Tax=Bacillus sp. JJ1764 TaxID=3122964 RepID=UPI0030000978
MPTDKELFNLMKETYSMNPRPDFVSDTELHLRKAARKMTRKRTFRHISISASGVLFCLITVLWIFSSNGRETIVDKITSLSDIKNSSSSIVNKQEPLIYIYHSHNQESFFPEIHVPDHINPIDQTKNITLVGEKLSQDLNEKNISNIHEKRNVMGILKERGLSFDRSYKVSREFLVDKIKENPSIKMAFDIHRDSQKRTDTTIKINGKDYAKIGFIISSSSKNSEENIKFAKKLHNKLQELYPGLSRGVIVKKNAEITYNQDLINNSVLMEIGGVENTLEEEYRTADAFAGVIENILNTK